jgi:hypothetical protein
MANATTLMEGALGRREFIAILLHEIGHIVNNPDSVHALVPDFDEFYADDYARYCGYSDEILSTLRSFLQTQPRFFSNDVTTKRIDRIERGDSLLLNDLIAGRRKSTE